MSETSMQAGVFIVIGCFRSFASARRISSGGSKTHFVALVRKLRMASVFQ